MFAPLFAIYAFCSKRGWHGAVLLLAACAILLARSGLLSSMLLGLIAYTGVITLIFDRVIRRDLQDLHGLGPAALLLAAIVAWQAAGLMLREPYEPQGIFVLGSAFGLAMLLPVFAAAAHHTPDFTRRFLLVLFAAGAVAALASLALHVYVTGGLRDFSLSRLLSHRLVPVGRAHHEILGAGGLVSAFFAGLALWRETMTARARYIVAGGLGLILLAVALTQSRGPMASLCLALAAAAATFSVRERRTRRPVALGLALLCALVPAALVLGEPWLQRLFCASDTGLCRISARQEVWWTVVGMIPERPWFGIGPAFRFPEGSVPHAHNGLLGSSFFFGVPVTLLFVALVGVALARTLQGPSGPGRTYALLGLFFGVAFVATDVSNPFAFINTHFLYLWYPLMLGVVLGSRAAPVRVPLASLGQPGQSEVAKLAS